MVTSPSFRRGSRELSRSDIDRLVDQNGRLRAEVARLEGELSRARAEVEAKGLELERLKSKNASLEAKLDATRREGKRQSAPFSRDCRTPENQRKRPGRKPGEAYGKKGRRLPLDPDEIDDDFRVPLPEASPACGEALGDVEPEKLLEHFQDELV